MTKILWQTVGVFAVVLVISFASCTTDSCTECTGVTGSSMQTFDTLICIDQFDSRSDYDDRVAVYESLGGSCIEQ